MSNALRILIVGFAITIAPAVRSQTIPPFAPGARVLVDAHNSYPYDGRWGNRIDRALATGVPVAIEQDLALYTDPMTRKTRVVVAHDPARLTGSESLLLDYFFERIRPLMERALSDHDRSRWPLITLNLDFKSDDPELIIAVHRILEQHRMWLTTSKRGKDIQVQQPLTPGPLLVLTGESDVQQKYFFDELPIDGDVLAFGAVHVNRQDPMASIEVLVSEHANNYRRWWNNAWAVVERGGQQNAGDWNRDDKERLEQLVQHAHQFGYWIRFYTLDGGTAEEFKLNGWFDGYNFGSIDAVKSRWLACMEAGVDFIATDQYEILAKTLQRYMIHESAEILFQLQRSNSSPPREVSWSKH